MAATTLHVGNLSFQMTEEELRTAFEGYGPVAGVRIVVDRDSGRPRGFAFVEMESEAGADAAIEGLNLGELGGRTLRVGRARPKR